jgi:hypothetical protein
MISWMKKGAESVAAVKQDAVEYEARKLEIGKMWRFFLRWKGDPKVKSESDWKAQITFVDGDLSPEGFLLPPRFYEHGLMLNGQVSNIVCPEKTNPSGGEDMKCPLCEGGDRPMLVAVFTIIDHRMQSSKDGTKHYKDTKRLLVVKSNTFEQLNMMAIKRGGLAGCKFDVMRVGEKAANVGDVFDFCDKKPVAELQAMYMDEVVDPKTNAKSMVTRFKPADYENEIVFRSGKELRAAGFGKPQVGMTGFANAATSGGEASTTDYAKNL